MAEVSRHEGGASVSSPELSSAPNSPARSSPLTQVTNATSYPQNSTIARKLGGVKDVLATTNLAKNPNPNSNPNPNPLPPPTSNTNTIVVAPRKPRKKKNPTTNSQNGTSSTATEGKEVKPRKPRAAPGTAATSRRKHKAEVSIESKTVISPRQPKFTDEVGSHPRLHFDVPHPTQNGNHEAITNTPVPASGHQTPPAQMPGIQTPRSSSGQNFDPVRSSTKEPSNPHKTFSVPTPPPAKPSNRASASPSISSLIDPPQTISIQPRPFSQPPPLFQKDSKVLPISPSKSHLSPPVRSLPSNDLPVAFSKPPESALVGKDTDREASCAPVKRSSSITKTGTSTDQSSSAASPKPPRQPKEAGPLLPSGNGLLSSTLFGGPSLDMNGLEKTAPTVILHVPLNGEINKCINFARLAEEQYGFNALHPRLAAQMERLARVAAAGAALENASKARGGTSTGSGDEMSVDLSDNEGEGADSNVEMGGMNGDGSKLGSGAEEGDKKPAPRKRKMKEDQYDKDDGFIDDTEMAWEEQAAASKDGFFVYSGPLVPEGEKPSVERPDGTVKRGRGRGRGGSTRGSGTGRGGRTAGTGDATTSTRGGNANRKPRVTKAAKAQFEHEKTEREKMAVLAAKPMSYPT